MTASVESATDGLSPERAAEITLGQWTEPPPFRVSGVAPLDEAGATELGFLASRRYLGRVGTSKAGALLVDAALFPQLGDSPRPCLIVPNAYEALRTLLLEIHPEPESGPAIHGTAVLGRGVELGENVTIGPYAVVDDGARLGDRCRIGAHVVVGRRASVGSDTVLHPHSVLYPGVRVGERVVLHAGARIGVDGFGYVFEASAQRKIPQVGRCEIGDDVEIGANTCVDRGSIGTTEVGAGTKVDNLVHIGHNVRIGRGAVLVAQVGIAGSTRVGEGAMLGGQAGIGGHIEIGAGARVGAQGGVVGDLEEGASVSGYPARDHRTYLRGMAHVFRLPELVRRVRELEDRLAELEGRDTG